MERTFQLIRDDLAQERDLGGIFIRKDADVFRRAGVTIDDEPEALDLVCIGKCDPADIGEDHGLTGHFAKPPTPKRNTLFETVRHDSHQRIFTHERRERKFFVQFFFVELFFHFFSDDGNQRFNGKLRFFGNGTTSETGEITERFGREKLSVIDGNKEDVIMATGSYFVAEEDGHRQERGQKDGNATPVGAGDSQQVFRFARHSTALESVFGQVLPRRAEGITAGHVFGAGN